MNTFIPPEDFEERVRNAIEKGKKNGGGVGWRAHINVAGGRSVVCGNFNSMVVYCGPVGNIIYAVE